MTYETEKVKRRHFFVAKTVAEKFYDGYFADLQSTLKCAKRVITQSFWETQAVKDARGSVETNIGSMADYVSWK